MLGKNGVEMLFGQTIMLWQRLQPNCFTPYDVISVTSYELYLNSAEQPVYVCVCVYIYVYGMVAWLHMDFMFIFSRYLVKFEMTTHLVNVLPPIAEKRHFAENVEICHDENNG